MQYIMSVFFEETIFILKFEIMGAFFEGAINFHEHQRLEATQKVRHMGIG